MNPRTSRERAVDVVTQALGSMDDSGSYQDVDAFHLVAFIATALAEARREALEEAARIGEKFEIEDEVSSRIRALKEKQQ